MARCHYCQIRLTPATAKNHHPDMYTRDHTHPKSMGGTKTVACCLRCNGMKGDMTMGEWNDFRARNPNWASMKSGDCVSLAKAAERALIFRKLRVSRIQPAWPSDVLVPLRRLGLYE